MQTVAPFLLFLLKRYQALRGKRDSGFVHGPLRSDYAPLRTRTMRGFREAKGKSWNPSDPLRSERFEAIILCVPLSREEKLARMEI